MQEYSVFNQFIEKVKQDPDALAVFDKDTNLSRYELYNLAKNISEDLNSSDRVGIIMDHSVLMIASILAALSVGAAYVPVEPSFPKERIRLILEDANVSTVITDEKYKDQFLDYNVIVPTLETSKKYELEEVEVNPDNIAYILYTSGSTGRPKGVAVRNRNVVSYIEAFENEFHPTQKDSILQYSVCTFDIFVEEVFSALLSGMVLAIPSEEIKNDLDLLTNFIEENNITIISGFPYLMADLNERENLPGSLRLLISGGDVLYADYIDNLIDKVDIYNTYGPSETTVCAAYFKCTKDSVLENGTFPIGKAVKGTKIRILDNNLKSVKIGETGEIYISGKGVSAGYFNSGGKENEAFKTLEDGTQEFSSGDLGYMLEDGNIIFVARKDLQVMIDGRRVEPKEVESVINQYDKIKLAAVKASFPLPSRPVLGAYIVWKDEEHSFEDFEEFLKTYLPDYMIPKVLVELNDLPTNANGKVDLKALPEINKPGTYKLVI